MDAKKILLIFLFSALIVGSVCAAESVNDFKVDKAYENVFNGTYYSLYLNENNDSGIVIYENVDDDAYADVDEGAYDDLIHDDGREYINGDDDFKLEKNPDHIANFTDTDHAEHGVVELVEGDINDYIIVVWAKDTSDIDTAKLLSEMDKFNKDNELKAIAF